MPSQLGTTGKLIAAFVTLLIGAVLIGSIATEGQAKTTYSREVDEGVAVTWHASTVNSSTDFRVAKYPTTWEIADCPLTTLSMKAGNGTPMTLTTDYTVTSYVTGQFRLVNNSNTYAAIPKTNTTLVSYNYCADDYMNSTWGRTVLNLVPGFFALAILGASLLLFYSVAKDYDII